jgi:group II intron reverse transcriptase/maturase
MDLLERVLEKGNMVAALSRVERNGGAPGVDGLTVEALNAYLWQNWQRIKGELLDQTYKPQPVRRVEIPKPDGGVRLLGIPSVVDRLIQQALLQQLQPIFEPTFSESSYGFRPNRSAHDAVKRAQQYVQEGYEWTVDLDIEKFFDRVNHDMLMARVARKVKDKRVLRLIRAYLNSGVMVEGVVMGTEEGTPQGGPISPLLANVLLDDLDKELEKRGHKFVRYADDSNIYVRTERAGQRVMESVREFLQKRLKLRLNEKKSSVGRPTKLKFLGFSMGKDKRKGGVYIRLAPRTVERFKTRVRELTSRSNGWGVERRVKELTTYLRGWLGYFRLADTPSVFKTLDGWVQRRLRMCLWKQWKRVRTKIRELRALGVPEWKCFEFANMRSGYWAVAHRPLNTVLGIAYWRAQGLFMLFPRYQQLRST